MPMPRRTLFARIVVKDGGKTSGNSVGVLERFGNFDSSHEIKAVVVATSDREGALWVYLPWQYADGNYTISGVYDTWTHNSGYTDDTTTEPTSNQRDTGYFDIVYNKTYPQFSNLRLRNGTDNYGSYLYFGDGSNSFICEPTDDSLQYKVGAKQGSRIYRRKFKQSGGEQQRPDGKWQSVDHRDLSTGQRTSS